MLAHTTKHHGKPWKQLRRAAAPLFKKIKQATTWDQASPSLAREDHSAPGEPSEVNGVLQIRLDEATAWVQPNVTMGTLVEMTMKEGLIPTVVAYSKNTTVLEAFTTGTYGSSSFRCGPFDCAVLSVEGVCHDGQKVMVKLNDNDVVDQRFEDIGAPHSLALITLLEIALTKAGNYVEMTYWPVRSVSGATLRMQPKGADSLIVDRSAVDESNDFLDIVMLGPAQGGVVTGRLIYTADRICSPFGESNPFVQHAESIFHDKLKHPRDTYVEMVPLVDYLFRYHDDDGDGDSSVLQDCASVVQNVVLPAEYLEEYVQDACWQKSACPVSITQAEPHSTFGRLRSGTQAVLDGDLWHIRVIGCKSKEKSN